MYKHTGKHIKFDLFSTADDTNSFTRNSVSLFVARTLDWINASFKTAFNKKYININVNIILFIT